MDWRNIFYTDIHGPHVMNPNDFNDPFLFLKRHQDVHTCGFE